MIVFRLCRAPFVALDGEGARLYGGRWNSPGRPALYAAATASLTVLEVLAHLDLSPDMLPTDYRLLQVEVPEDGPFEALDRAPAEPEACAAAGDAFLDRGAALGLWVPSVIVPQERNLILNIRHPAASRLTIVANEGFRLDPRLLEPFPLKDGSSVSGQEGLSLKATTLFIPSGLIQARGDRV